MVVRQGRALAVSTAWIAGPLVATGALLSLITYNMDNEWAPWLPLIAIWCVVVLTPVGILIASGWVSYRAGKAESAAALGREAGLIGLAGAIVGAVIYGLMQR